MRPTSISNVIDAIGPTSSDYSGCDLPIGVAARPITPTSIDAMAILRLFAGARDAAGVGRDEIAGDTVDDVITTAIQRYGESFATVLGTCKIWVNGEPAMKNQTVVASDEIAVLPPVSGGAR